MAIIVKYKARYEAPAIQLVELQTRACLCGGSNRSTGWTYDNDLFRPDPNAGWGRDGYGDALGF